MSASSCGSTTPDTTTTTILSPPMMPPSSGTTPGGGGGEEDDAGPIMECCVVLLEPILGVFVSNCIARDEERANKRRRSSKEEGRRRGPPDESDNDGEEESDGEEVDEVPPQLTRVARFFPHRFSPMRRALLRPPPPSPPPGEGDGVGVDVELAARYRLRLARACRARGLLVDAEYESLRASFERVARGEDDDDDDDDCYHDDVGGGERAAKRRRAEGEEDGRGRRDDDDCGGGGEDDDDDDDGVRLSLKRLPADSVASASTSSSSSSSRGGRSIAAWRHVVESLSRWGARWEEENDRERRRRDDGDGGATDGRDIGGPARRVARPDRVADWAMTSWTAMLLLRGIPDHRRGTVPRRTHPGAGGDAVDRRGGAFAIVVDPAEKQLAALLSDRRDSSSTATLATAVERRIDSLLSPENLPSLNGVHLYSLGRLLASLRDRDDALAHVASSICGCAAAAMLGGGGGGGGLVGLDQLSRLLAVYACCCASASSATTATATSSWNVTASTTSVTASSTVRDLEIGLRSKLDDDKLVRRAIVAERTAKVRGGIGGGGNLRDPELRAQQRQPLTALVKRRAMSFMDAVLSTTAHLVKCCEK